MLCCLGSGVELQNGIILWLWKLWLHCTCSTNLCHALGFTRLAWLIEVCSVAHKEHNRCERHNNLIKTMRNSSFLFRWGTSLTCVTCAQCQQMRRRLLLRRTTSASLRRRRWTPPTWRRPSTIFSQVNFLGFLLPSTAFPILSLPLTKNTLESAVGGY